MSCRISVRSFLGMGLSVWALWLPDRVFAQILPDATLPENSIVTPEANLQRITGGTQARSNLFHSFSEFNVRTGETAHFENTLAIDNIITRVTGEQLSNIDGILRTNGSANLFLVNPNGIHFGANAQLDIGGSFVASTASGVNFADGSEFLTTGGDTPLLTVSVPVGLQFNRANPGSITSNGSNLAVSTRQTLGLVGGDIALSGGTLAAGGSPFIEVDGIPTATTLGGRIELGSVRQGEVGIATGDRGLNFNYVNVSDFGNIQLERRVNVGTTGTGGGDVQVFARNLQMRDLSSIFSITQGSQAGGNVTVNATESVELVGTGDFTQTLQQFTSPGANQFTTGATGLYNLTFGTGNGGELAIETPQLLARNNVAILSAAQGMSAGPNGALTINASEYVEVTAALIASSNGAEVMGNSNNLTVRTSRLLVQDDGLILTTTFGPSQGGDLTIEADRIELTRVRGFALNSFFSFGTAIATGSLGTGNAGNLTIDARTIELSDSAQINSGTIDSGQGGSLRIEASESIELRGGNSGEELPTQENVAMQDNVFNTTITATTLTVGNAGNLSLTTPRLILRDGATITADTFGQGMGGTINIQADIVELSGISPDGRLPTTISGRSINLFGGGSAGNVQIDTDRLIVRDGARVAVSSQGRGRAGNLEINAADIQLDRHAELTAATAAGEQGNITLNASAIVLRHGSRITTNSIDTASGGNITIDTDTLVALEDSDITANAQESFGGRVTIDTQGIFGTAFRERLTPNSDITATGETEDKSGMVTITTPDLDPSSGFVELSSVTVDTEGILERGCLTPSASQRGRFTVVGAGGLPDRPNNPASLPFETFAIPSGSSELQERANMTVREEIVEAEGIFQLEDDRFVLGRLCS